MRRSGFSATALAIAGVLALGASSALAGGPPVVNTTDHLVDFTETFIDVHPCTGQDAEITIIGTGVMHFLAFADGTVRVTGSLRGSFSGDLLRADGTPDGTPDATGRFVESFASNGAITETGSAFGKAVTTFTLNGKGTNADGSTFSFHVNGHAVFDGAGDVRLEFFKTHCN